MVEISTVHKFELYKPKVDTRISRDYVWRYESIINAGSVLY